MFKTKTENRLFYFFVFQEHLDTSELSDLMTDSTSSPMSSMDSNFQPPNSSSSHTNVIMPREPEDCRGSRPTVPTSLTQWTLVSGPRAPSPSTPPPPRSPPRPLPVPRWAWPLKTRQRNNWHWVDCGPCWTSQQHPVEQLKSRSEREVRGLSWSAQDSSEWEVRSKWLSS